MLDQESLEKDGMMEDIISPIETINLGEKRNLEIVLVMRQL